MTSRKTLLLILDYLMMMQLFIARYTQLKTKWFSKMLVKLAEWEQLWGMKVHPQKVQLPQNLQIQKTKNIQIHYKICHPSRWNFNEIPWRNLRSVYNDKFGMSVMTNVNEHDISNCVIWHVVFDKRGTVDEQNNKNQRCHFFNHLILIEY